MLPGTAAEKRELANCVERGLRFKNVVECHAVFLDLEPENGKYSCCFLGLSLVGKKNGPAKADRAYHKGSDLSYIAAVATVLNISEKLTNKVEQLHLANNKACKIIKQLRKEATVQDKKNKSRKRR